MPFTYDGKSFPVPNQRNKEAKKKKAKMYFLTFSALVKSNHQNRQNDQIMITVCIR